MLEIDLLLEKKDRKSLVESRFSSMDSRFSSSKEEERSNLGDDASGSNEVVAFGEMIRREPCLKGKLRPRIDSVAASLQ